MFMFIRAFYWRIWFAWLGRPQNLMEKALAVHNVDTVEGALSLSLFVSLLLVVFKALNKCWHAFVL